jgi:hypothetical protein
LWQTPLHRQSISSRSNFNASHLNIRANGSTASPFSKSSKANRGGGSVLFRRAVVGIGISAKSPTSIPKAEARVTVGSPKRSVFSPFAQSSSPDLIHLENEGHLALVPDLGLEKSQKRKDEESTYALTNASLIYFAPELLQGDNGSKALWWAVGAVAFELLTNKPLFAEEQPHQLYKNVFDQQQVIVFPESLSTTARSLLTGVSSPLYLSCAACFRLNSSCPFLYSF